MREKTGECLENDRSTELCTVLRMNIYKPTLICSVYIWSNGVTRILSKRETEVKARDGAITTYGIDFCVARHILMLLKQIIFQCLEIRFLK